MAATARAAHRGVTKAEGFYSVYVTIPDDDVYSFTPKGTFGHVLLAGNNASYRGLVAFAAGAINVESGTVVASTSALNGTTGVDGDLTFAINAGVCYLENRTGAQRTWVLTIFTFNDNHD